MSFFFFPLSLYVTTFTPHIPKKTPGEESEPCLDSRNTNRTDKAVTVIGTNSALVTAVRNTTFLAGNEPEGR